MLKTLTLITENHMIIRAGVDFSISCRICHEVVKGPFCPKCKRIASNCAICHLPARGKYMHCKLKYYFMTHLLTGNTIKMIDFLGLSTFCSMCGHGGHSAHMLHWFKTKKMCATGCGCHCIEENTRVFK